MQMGAGPEAPQNKGAGGEPYMQVGAGSEAPWPDGAGGDSYMQVGAGPEAPRPELPTVPDFRDSPGIRNLVPASGRGPIMSRDFDPATQGARTKKLIKGPCNWVWQTRVIELAGSYIHC